MRGTRGRLRLWRCVAGAAALLAVATGCGGAANGPSPTAAPTTVSPASPTPTAHPTKPPNEAQLVAVAQRVYFGSDGHLADCAQKAGNFVGFESCPFTERLLGTLSPPNVGDTLACASQAVQPAPAAYAATVGGSGGMVQISIPASPSIVYTLTIVSTGGLLEVDGITFTEQGVTRELTAKWCAGTAVSASPGSHS